MTSVELLERAAALLRQHADFATAGPWNSSPVDSKDAFVTSAVYSYAHPTGSPESEVVGAVRKQRGGGLKRGDDARYIALMHPPVALALADWLEAAAASIGIPDQSVAGRWAAVAVARAILREEP